MRFLGAGDGRMQVNPDEIGVELAGAEPEGKSPLNPNERGGWAGAVASEPYRPQRAPRR
jgi:hypothetical protein